MTALNRNIHPVFKQILDGDNIKKARNGEIKNFTGIDSPFEEPVNPDIELKTDELTIEDSTKQAMKIILPIIEY